MTEEDPYIHQKNKEEREFEEKYDQSEIDFEKKDLLYRLEDWRVEHKIKYPSYDERTKVYYTDLAKDAAQAARLSEAQSKTTTIVKDPAIAELMKKREEKMKNYARLMESTKLPPKPVRPTLEGDPDVSAGNDTAGTGPTKPGASGSKAPPGKGAPPKK